MSSARFEPSQNGYAYHNVGDHDQAAAFRKELESNYNFGLAYHLVVEGFSVLPLRDHSKIPARRWKPYQRRYPTLVELVEWFVIHDFLPGIVTGNVSGITVVDCDSAAAADAWEQEAPTTLVQQQTARGRHYVYQYNGERNRRGAFKGIDRRGEGGYVKAYADSRYWTANAVSQAPLLRSSEA